MLKSSPAPVAAGPVQSHVQASMVNHAERIEPMTEGVLQLQDGAPEVVIEQFAVHALHEMAAGVTDLESPCEVTIRWVRDGRTMAAQTFTTEAKWLRDAGRCRRWVTPCAHALRDAMLAYAISGEV